MNKIQIMTLSGMISMTGVSIADTSTGIDPYATGKGFETPSEAIWGGWSRGDEGSFYAEWDVFDDASYGTDSDQTAAPDRGNFNAEDSFLQWGAGSFITGGGNLYSFSVPQNFLIRTEESTPGNELRVILQIETQGVALNNTSVTLSGRSPDFQTVTFTDPHLSSPAGETELIHTLYYWDLTEAEAKADYQFEFSGDAHMSLSQVAVDIGKPQSHVNADFAERLLTIPCVDVRNSPFDGYYRVVMKQTDDNGQNWRVETVDVAEAEACSAAMEQTQTHRLLQSTGLLETTISDSADRGEINRIVIADFAYRLLLAPCLEVKQSTVNGFYHVALEITNDNGLEWTLEDVKAADLNACRY